MIARSSQPAWVTVRQCLKEKFLLKYISQWGPWLLPITRTLKDDWSWSSSDFQSAGRALGKHFLLLIVNKTGTKQVFLPQTCSYCDPGNLLQLSYSLNDLGEALPCYAKKSKKKGTQSRERKHSLALAQPRLRDIPLSGTRKKCPSITLEPYVLPQSQETERDKGRFFSQILFARH